MEAIQAAFRADHYLRGEDVDVDSFCNEECQNTTTPLAANLCRGANLSAIKDRNRSGVEGSETAVDSEMASSQPEGRLQLDHYPFRLKGYLDRPSSYTNQLDTISNSSAGWIDAISV
jgi:hypothetical protein